MKKLVTISGTPASANMVVKDVALQLGKIALVWIATDLTFKALLKTVENPSRTNIDWNHPAFKTLH